MDGGGLDPGQARLYVQPRGSGTGAALHTHLLASNLARPDWATANRTMYPPPPSPLPLSKAAMESELPKPPKRPAEVAETAAGLSQLSQTSVPATPLAVATPRQPAGGDEGSPTQDRELERIDKRFKTIRKSFSAEEERVYAAVFDHYLRNEEKVVTLNELTTHLEGKIPARFSENEKKNFIRSTYYNLAVQFSRMHKLQLRMLLQDTESQRWLEEPSLMAHAYADDWKRRETDRRINELARDLAARSMGASSTFIRPSDQEVARARALIVKWMNPQLRPILLNKHEQPKKRRRGDSRRESGSPVMTPDQ